MSDRQETLDVYQTGPLTVVGFGGREILDLVDVTKCRDQLIQLIQAHRTQTLAFDLAGVRLIPSGMLGLLASIRRQNVAVEIYNPPNDVLEVLEITGLTKIMPVSYTDGDGSPTA